MGVKENCKKRILSLISICFLSLSFVFYCEFSGSVSFAIDIVKPEQIILTWTEDPSTSQTITWLISADLPAQIQYVDEERFRIDNFSLGKELNVEGIPFAGNDFRYTVNINGLKPDTTYLYRVGGEGFWSEILSFTTAADTDEFSFLYMGDVQGEYTEWANYLDVIYDSHPEISFSLLGGDLTNNGSDEKEWGEFLDAASTLFSRIPLMPTLGNHDGIMYKNFFALPVNGPQGLEGEFYSFDYGNAHFVVLNSNNNTNQKAREWLIQDLKTSDKTWKFVLFHHPAYPAYDDRKGIDRSIRNNWIPILEEYGVDIVLVGHQHEYMRTYKILQDNIQRDLEKEGVIYIMGNASSKKYISDTSYPYIAIKNASSNYQIFDIKDKQLSFTAKTTDGEIIDSFILKKDSLNPVDNIGQSSTRLGEYIWWGRKALLNIFFFLQV